MKNKKHKKRGETTMQEYKAYFVAKYLKPLLLAAEVDVKDAEYLEEGGEEYLRITYFSGETDDVNVTWDGLMSMTKAAIKAVTEA